MPRDHAKLYPHDHLMRALVLPFIPRFVHPNHITALRMVLTPVCTWGLAIEAYAWAVPFFAFVAFTDVVDGSLARVRKQVTEWGILFDPVADKLLIAMAAMVVLTKAVGSWLAIALVTCELMIVFGAVRKKFEGKIMMANAWGKTKMFCECAGILSALFFLWFHVPLFLFLTLVFLFAAMLFALVSLFTYSL
jgi:CDP-diacylglycerol--glycerol-3-phosphate 3-phosphatidyltransferase